MRAHVAADDIARITTIRRIAGPFIPVDFAAPGSASKWMKERVEQTFQSRAVMVNTRAAGCVIARIDY